MIVVELVLLGVLAAAAVAVAVVVIRQDDESRVRAREAERRADELARLELERQPEVVRVHYSDDDRSVEGVLVSVSRDHYRLANARQFSSTESSVALDGEAWIPRDRVLLVQRL